MPVETSLTGSVCGVQAFLGHPQFGQDSCVASNKVPQSAHIILDIRYKTN